MTGHSMHSQGFLTRLLRNEAGNTLAIVAALIIPLLGLVGGGIDMSRLYLVKSRMQQACDAGALAGRKVMGTGSWTTGTTSSSDGRANAIFNGNFLSGDYGTGTLTKSFSETGGTVTGTASTVVPMTIMKALGFTSETINVSCTAKMEIPNTDVMFVLDVTGSMLDCPDGSTCNGNSSSKIAGLKGAVKCFYEALVKVNTTEVCGNDPTATAYSGTAQIRFGFVPYSVNVNVGKLLPNSYLEDSWDYQSRETVPTGTSTTSGSWTKISGTYNSNTNKKQNSCTASSNVSTVDGTTTTATSTDSMGGTVTTTTYTRTKNGTEVTCSKNGSKSDIITDTYSNYKEYKTDITAPTYAYLYHPRNFNVSGLKAGGSSWNNSISLNIGWMNANTSVTWEGCVEERYTVENSDGDPSDEWTPLPSAAYDTDIDMVPSAISGTKWAPVLEGAVWRRYSGSNRTESDTNYGSSANAPCPTQAKKLQTWTAASPFETYVNSLSPTGNTYHDIGLIWGARLMSPTGIFASENATTTGGQPIQRHLVFMTDGDTNVQLDDYSAYGLNWWDHRQTTYEPSKSDLDDILDARVGGICAAIRNKNITVWVISFGNGVASSTQTRLQNCASTPNGAGAANTHFFNASDTASLLATFQQIAAEISDLRLTS